MIYHIILGTEKRDHGLARRSCPLLAFRVPRCSGMNGGKWREVLVWGLSAERLRRTYICIKRRNSHPQFIYIGFMWGNFTLTESLLGSERHFGPRYCQLLPHPLRLYSSSLRSFGESPDYPTEQRSWLTEFRLSTLHALDTHETNYCA